MTPLNLVESFSAELREVVSKYKFIAQYQEDRKVTVYEQDMPVAEFKNVQIYPFVLVEILNVEDDVTDSVTSLLLTIGCYQGEERRDGYREFLNLTETIRQYILTHEVIGKQFILQPPIYFGVVEKQSDDFIFGNFFVQYRIPRPTKSYVR